MRPICLVIQWNVFTCLWTFDTAVVVKPLTTLVLALKNR